MTNGFAAIIGFIAFLAYAMDSSGTLSSLFCFITGAAFGQILCNCYLTPWVVRRLRERE